MAATPQDVPGAQGAQLPLAGFQSPKGGFTQDGVEMNAVQLKQMALMDQMILWQLSNPGKPWTDCARAMGVSAMWCRMLASTDAYRARYLEASDQALKDVGLFGIQERLKAATEITLERLAEKMALCESVGDITDAAEVLLKSQYGQASAPSPQTHVHVHADVIMQARGSILSSTPAIDVKELPNEESAKD